MDTATDAIQIIKDRLKKASQTAKERRIATQPPGQKQKNVDRPVLSVIIGLNLLGSFDIKINCKERTMTLQGGTIFIIDHIYQKEKEEESQVLEEPQSDDIAEKIAKVEVGIAEEGNKVQNLLQRYREAWESPKPGKCKIYSREFKVFGTPIRAKARPVPPELKPWLEKQIHNMLDKGVVEPSDSPWAASAHFVPKKTGDWRLVMDYRPVNRCMIHDAYPLPNIWSTIQDLAGRNYYTTLDLAAGFWNCPIGEESRQYTSFICSLGQFHYTVLPFGIRNSPANLQRTCDLVFADLLKTGQCKVYMDDIGLATYTLEEHYAILEAIQRI